MRAAFQRTLTTAKRIPLLGEYVGRIERVLQQRNDTQALFREGIEDLFLKLVPASSTMEDLRNHPTQIDKYHRLVQRQSLIVHPNGKGRAELADKELRGRGLEVGGLHCPVFLPEGCDVSYLDAHSHSGLRAGFPYLRDYLLVIPNFVSSGESLSEVPEASLDFIIANHMLEHSINPLKVLITFASRLKGKGVAFLAIPDKRATFDRKRKLTTAAHVIKDFESATPIDHEEEIREFAKFAAGLKGEALENYIRNFDGGMSDIHYHVWDADSFRELMQACEARSDWPFASHSIHSYPEEFIVVLKK